jgi:hypothetical protein
MSIQQRALKTSSSYHIPMSSLNFDLMINLEINKSHWLFRMCTSVTILVSVKQRVLKILSSQNIPMSSLTPELWFIDRTTLGGHWFFMMYQCTKLDIQHTKWSQETEWSVYSYVQCDPWPYDFSINRVYLFFRMHQVLSLKSVKHRVFEMLSG